MSTPAVASPPTSPNPATLAAEALKKQRENAAKLAADGMARRLAAGPPTPSSAILPPPNRPAPRPVGEAPKTPNGAPPPLPSPNGSNAPAKIAIGPVPPAKAALSPVPGKTVPPPPPPYPSDRAAAKVTSPVVPPVKKLAPGPTSPTPGTTSTPASPNGSEEIRRVIPPPPPPRNIAEIRGGTPSVTSPTTTARGSSSTSTPAASSPVTNGTPRTSNPTSTTPSTTTSAPAAATPSSAARSVVVATVTTVATTTTTATPTPNNDNKATQPAAPLIVGADGEPIVETLDGFTLETALKAIASDTPEVDSQLDTDEAEMRELRTQIASSARRNFILERELNELDEKIKLLIKNRITVQEVLAQTGGLKKEEEGKEDEKGGPLKGKLHLYEEMCYLLQSKPKYFAKLARVVSAKDTPVFVQTVVFDMYGDQYDTREERLLLTLFRIVLKDELDQSTDKGSLFRANTAITQMLSAYARRGQGLSILKDILEQPLRSLTSRKDLNLEINPAKVYTQMITDSETTTGRASDLPANVADDVAAANPEVIRIIEQRTAELLKLSDYILQRIITSGDTIPYGMRWICKTLADLARRRFPDIDRYQCGSLMGGYIYLRFFNPVIVTPDAVNFISTKPNRIVRRNLILIAKVLQNLSNGVEFHDAKEPYMKVANPFIQERTEPLQEYFEKLSKVDDVDDTVQVDKFLEHTRGIATITLSYNQLFLMHQLLLKHQTLLCDEKDDPMVDVLRRLGPAPAQLDKENNRSLALQLQDRRKDRMSTATEVFASTTSGGPKINPLYLQAKNLLLSVLRRLPTSSALPALMTFLQEEKVSAGNRGDSNLADNVNNVMSMLKTLAGMNMLPKLKTPDDTFNLFLWGFAQDAMARRKRVVELEKKIALIKHALSSIDTHHTYLLSRLDMYKVYLDNARRGGAQVMTPTKTTKKAVVAKTKTHKWTHSQLEEMKVIVKVNPDIPKSVLKKCAYIFTMDTPGKFQVQAVMKAGVEVKVMSPIELVLEELLTKQEHGTTVLDVDAIQLNINLLIHTLNTHFMVDKK